MHHFEFWRKNLVAQQQRKSSCKSYNNRTFIFLTLGKPEGSWKDSWYAMEHLYHEGKIRGLGVSNFDVVDLKELLNITKVNVSVVQNWFDPFHQDENVRMFCAKHHIHYMGYSTLGTSVILLRL
jgi:diketogulonate reductase-like aldo/keto reductase